MINLERWFNEDFLYLGKVGGRDTNMENTGRTRLSHLLFRRQALRYFQPCTPSVLRMGWEDETNLVASLICKRFSVQYCVKILWAFARSYSDPLQQVWHLQISFVLYSCSISVSLWLLGWWANLKLAWSTSKLQCSWRVRISYNFVGGRSVCDFDSPHFLGTCCEHPSTVSFVIPFNFSFHKRRAFWDER